MIVTVPHPPRRRLARIVGLAAVLLSIVACAPTAPPAPAPVTVRDDLGEVLVANGTPGTFAVLDTGTGERTLVDATRAATRTAPESTFKLVHALLALDTGVVVDPDRQLLPYGGGRQPVAGWERDMTLREAVTESNAAVFVQLARRIGADGEREWVRRLGYGNAEIGDRPDRFWLGGPLAVSPVEQTDLVARLATRTLPASQRAQAIVADIVRLERTPGHTLYGKTGWRFDVGPGDGAQRSSTMGPGATQLGWWVGWLERPGRAPVTFALTIDMRGAQDAPSRVALGRRLLERLGLLDTR